MQKYDETDMQAVEMWCYRRMLRIKWMEKRTKKNILHDELQTRRESLPKLSKEKLLSLNVRADIGVLLLRHVFSE